MSLNTKSVLVTLADARYIDQAKQLFSSAYFNGGWQGNFLLLAFDIEDENLKWFLDRNILVKKCYPICHENDLKQYYFYWEKKYPIIANSKLYLFTDYFKNWENIVFLDADIIVLSSLDKLARVKNFCAAEDVIFKLRDQFVNFNDLNCNEDRSLFNELKNEYDLNSNAFNAGVFAFNSKIIQEDTFEKLSQIFLRFKNITHMAEQAVLNLFFLQSWKELYAVYNASSLFVENDSQINSPLIHFNSGPKPWKPDSKFNELWKKNLLKADGINCQPRIKRAAELSWLAIWLGSKKLKKAYRKWYH